MPVLPSGRRVEFSLDRFHALLSQMGGPQSKRIANALHGPDDLFAVLDAVHFSTSDGTPFFAEYVAADWMPYAAEWSATDRDALRVWLASDSARQSRAEAIDYIKALILDESGSHPHYPYVIPEGIAHHLAHQGSTTRQ